MDAPRTLADPIKGLHDARNDDLGDFGNGTMGHRCDGLDPTAAPTDGLFRPGSHAATAGVLPPGNASADCHTASTGACTRSTGTGAHDAAPRTATARRHGPGYRLALGILQAAADSYRGARARRPIAVAYAAWSLCLVIVGAGRAEICVVRAPEGGSMFSQGHGVYVGHGIVLTAWHVLRDAQGEPTLEFRGRAYTGRRVARAKEGWDLAAINIDEPSGLTPSKLYRGGWPSVDVRTQRSNGEPVQGLNEPGLGQVFAFRGASLPGDSGGPIWCNEGVVSVVSGSDYESITIGPPPPVVQAFFVRASQAWCPDCIPGSPTGPVIVGRQPVVVPDDGPAPQPPPVSGPEQPTPTDPPQSAQATQPMIDTEAIANTILEKLRTDPAFRGPEGPVGPAGPAGPPGPEGPPGKAPDIDPDAIRQALAEHKAQIDELTKAVFSVEVIQFDGSVQTGQVTAHGGLLRLDFSQ